MPYRDFSNVMVNINNKAQNDSLSSLGKFLTAGLLGGAISGGRSRPSAQQNQLYAAQADAANMQAGERRLANNQMIAQNQARTNIDQALSGEMGLDHKDIYPYVNRQRLGFNKSDAQSLAGVISGDMALGGAPVGMRSPYQVSQGIQTMAGTEQGYSNNLANASSRNAATIQGRLDERDMMNNHDMRKLMVSDVMIPAVLQQMGIQGQGRGPYQAETAEQKKIKLDMSYDDYVRRSEYDRANPKPGTAAKDPNFELQKAEYMAALNADKKVQADFVKDSKLREKTERTRVAKAEKAAKELRELRSHKGKTNTKYFDEMVTGTVSDVSASLMSKFSGTDAVNPELLEQLTPVIKEIYNNNFNGRGFDLDTIAREIEGIESQLYGMAQEESNWVPFTDDFVGLPKGRSVPPRQGPTGLEFDPYSDPNAGLEPPTPTAVRPQIGNPAAAADPLIPRIEMAKEKGYSAEQIRQTLIKSGKNPADYGY